MFVLMRMTVGMRLFVDNRFFNMFGHRVAHFPFTTLAAAQAAP